MARIRGHYEWDDDDLTPGRKREGGLHQNLYDSDGNLKGNARFVPDDGTDPQPVVVTETVYIPADERRRTHEDDELAEFVADVVGRLAARGIAAAAPVVAQWFRDTARPSLAAQRARVRQWRERRTTKKDAVVEATLVEPSGGGTVAPTGEPSEEMVGALDERRPNMSRAEAQARYLAAIAARAYSDEQMRLVSGANIVDGGGVVELERSLAELPADQLKALIETMATSPAMLGEDSLAQLASLLGARALRA
ncbi:MAG: hypothetical protein FWD95_00635 [Nocardioidaceae bacterium]|nr:hypothetical protein [Nocardioidaceae bacterium]